MELVERVDAMGVSVSLLSAQWFLTLFVDVVPVATSCRIWDNLFFDGLVKVQGLNPFLNF